MKYATILLMLALIALARAHAAELQQEDLCAQPSPKEMAAAAGVTLPPPPWHVVNIWWNFEKPAEHFESLEMDVTVDRDVPSTYNLYISPVGVAKINGLQFYGGIQTNINGWASKQSRERIFRGKGAIFSRWSSDKKTPIGLEHARMAADDCLVESAGYEGEFASVRRPLAWGKGTWTYQIVKGEREKIGEATHTWFTCRVRDPKGMVHDIGSLRFEGEDFTYWDRHSAFAEVYSTSRIPRSGIPKVNVTFGWPRINGQKVRIKSASAYYPAKTGPASPDCAWVKADGENCRTEIGPIFKRDERQRRHGLEIKMATPANHLEVVRFQANPIVRPDMLPGHDGENINGPSLIRTPAWLPNPLGKFYLYFAHHNGKYIRLAYSDHLEGPWKIHEPGTLRLEDAPGCQGHIASPDAVVDEERREIRLYFHGPARAGGGQKTFLAASKDGLHFKAGAESLGIFYWRVFRWDGWWYGMAKGGLLYRSRDGRSDFEEGPNPFPGSELRDKEYNTPGVRHVALHQAGNRLWVYYSNIGDAPERLFRSSLELGGDWKTWKTSEPQEVLRPETAWEGARLPLKKSAAGAVNRPENALRDPAIFIEDGRVYLLYSVAGESGIAIAECRSNAPVIKPSDP